MVEGRSDLKQKLPKHVAIVMDGNGRWANAHGLPRSEGHRQGVEVVKTIVKSCLEKKISILSLFAFGIENWARPEEEVSFLMELFVIALDRELEELHKNGVKLNFIGDKNNLAARLIDKITSAETLTNHNKNLILNIALNYSGRWDIIQATRRLAGLAAQGELKVTEITESLFSSFMSTPIPDPDLFIRTSGEQRISDFFLWQLAYTELYFTDVMWPDFTINDFAEALADFSTRERRFGLISKQLKTDNNV